MATCSAARRVACVRVRGRLVRDIFLSRRSVVHRTLCVGSCLGGIAYIMVRFRVSRSLSLCFAILWNRGRCCYPCPCDALLLCTVMYALLVSNVLIFADRHRRACDHKSALILLSRSVGRLVCRSVGWSFGRLVCRSVGWSVGRSVDRPVSRLVGCLVGRSVGRSVGD